MVSVIVILFLTYFLLVMALIVGWYKVLGQRKQALSTQHGVSVVVSARNEERTIGLLLQDLMAQEYRDFEVIVVDDHSDDNTRTIVEEIARTDSRFRLIGNPEEGKKQAITHGIQAANW